MAGYEALLDPLGLKILDRRLRRDHAERTRTNRINETERLNVAVREERKRQEERSAQIERDREAKEKNEYEQLLAMVREKIDKLPPEEREMLKRKNKKHKKTSVSSRTARILERLLFAHEKERRTTFS